MKVALITTTIYVPEVLRTYRQYGPDVAIFIAGDRQTPHAAVYALAHEIGNAIYLSDTDQEKLGYECSELIGWNRIMRRNLALLEAIRWGAGIVITVDDDNEPLNTDYASRFTELLTYPWSGPTTRGDSPELSPDLFNVGALTQPPIFHRGFPFTQRVHMPTYRFPHRTGQNIGVAAGLWYGEPDVDAVNRLASPVSIERMNWPLSDGLFVQPGTYTPVNSQNTAYRGDLAPLFMVWTGVGRYDDIWASYAAERIMAKLGYGVHFGPPFTRQERNTQSIWRNLQAELFGMEYTPCFLADLQAVHLAIDAPLIMLARLYEQMATWPYLPPIVCELGRAWCRDVEKLL